MRIEVVHYDTFSPHELERSIHGARVAVMKLASGPFSVELARCTGSALVMDHGIAGSDFAYSGALDPGHAKLRYACALPGDARFRGRVMCPHQLEYLHPGGEFDGRFPAGARWFDLSFTGAPLLELVRHHAGPAAADALGQADSLAVPIASTGRERLRRLATFAYSGAVTGRATTASFERAFIGLVLGVFLEPLNHGRDWPRDPNRRYRLVRRVTEHALACLHEPIGLSGLALAAGVSVRTLEYAFRVVHGVSAGDYLRKLRLNRVYGELQAAEAATTTVTRIATHWGFWHMGEFGAAYKRLFGERPSDTLKRESRTPPRGGSRKSVWRQSAGQLHLSEPRPAT